MTYSIVARDGATGEFGAAVQSHYFAVGRRCLTAVPGVGAVASQALGSASHGPLLMRAVSQGDPPQTVLAALLATDPNSKLRQVSAVAVTGIAAYTGAGCIPSANHAVSTNAVAAGNTLTGPHAEVMLDAFESTSGQLEHRLLAALDAAEAEGGDARGKMSAALRIVSGEPSEWPQDGTRVDVRIDFSGEPLAELRDLVALASAHRTLTTDVLSPGRLVGSGAPRIDERNGPRILADLERVQAAFPDDLEPTFWRGVVALRIGDNETARDCFRRAIASRPAYEDLAEGLHEVGRLVLPDGGVQALLDGAT